MTERQKIEGATAVHLEETRVKMMMAIGQAPPLDDAGMLQHLREYALEVSPSPPPGWGMAQPEQGMMWGWPRYLCSICKECERI